MLSKTLLLVVPLSFPAKLFAIPLLFDTWVSYDVGSSPFSIVATDLDGDGKLDLAVANEDDNAVSVLKNNGDGTFATKVDYGTGELPISIFAADLDGDGKLDLAVAKSLGHSVSVLKNNGDGTFATQVEYGTGSYPTSVFASDLNGDGKRDLAVANYGSNTVSVLNNNGDGTFAAKVDYVIEDSPYSGGPYCVIAADLDGDGKPDLAVTNIYWSNTVSVLKNNGDGTFAAKVDYQTGEFPSSVIATDLDGDGKLDIAVANSRYNSNTVSVLKNNGDGTFSAKIDYGTGYRPMSVVSADLDGDGDLDLATSNIGDNTVSVLKNLSLECALAVKGDMNCDGSLSSSDVVLLLNCVFQGVGNCALTLADGNCSGNLTGADVVLELYALFRQWPFPC